MRLRVWNGPVDAEHFAAEAVELYGRLVRVVLAVGGERPLAEDCAQDALVKAWERVDRGESLRSLEAWTVTVALNGWRSHARRAQAERRAIERLGPDVEEVVVDRVSTEVHRAVLSLPDRQREVVVLYYLLDLDVASIARIVGRSSGAVKNALFHARASLADRLTSVAVEED